MNKIIPIRPEVCIMGNNDGRGEFFVVDTDTLIDVCSLGANEAATYLTMACGTGGDNTSTCWGAKAVARYTGVRWRTADKAIKTLLRHEIILQSGKVGLWNQYKIDRQGEPIWLPCELVMGVTDRPSPIKQLRQTQDPMLIRLLVELYQAQNLWEDDGVSTDVFRQQYDRQEMGEFGANTAWEFIPNGCYMKLGNPIAEIHRQDEEIQPFFDRIRTLLRLGLIEFIRCVMDSEDGEPVFYIDAEMQEEIDDALDAVLSEPFQAKLAESHEVILIPRHMQRVHMVGIARLTFRPKTKATSAWYGEYMDMQREYIRMYRRLSGKPIIAESPQPQPIEQLGKKALPF